MSHIKASSLNKKELKNYAFVYRLFPETKL